MADESNGRYGAFPNILGYYRGKLSICRFHGKIGIDMFFIFGLSIVNFVNYPAIGVPPWKWKHTMENWDFTTKKPEPSQIVFFFVRIHGKRQTLATQPNRGIQEWKTSRILLHSCKCRSVHLYSFNLIHMQFPNRLQGSLWMTTRLACLKTAAK